MQHAIRVAALFCLLALTAIFPANAQSAAIVTTCGAQSLGHAVFGSSGLYIDQTGNLCVAASVSASITGFPGTTQTTGTPISVTTGGVTGALPSGSVVVASNVGSTNGAYCKLGASATTSDQLISPNSWFAFTVGSNTQLTCITSTSTTTVNMVGGSGLPTGAGGGGGGGGSSGAVFGPTAVGSAAANPPVLIAGTANAGATGNVQVAKVSASGLVSVDGSAVTQPVSGTVTAAQATAASLNATVVPSTLAAWGLVASTQNGATPTNGQLSLGQFNTSPTTITSGNVSPLQLDNAGNLLVNVKAGGAGGGAVFGPTAVGTAAANPPVLAGGTADGTATGAVAVQTIKAGNTAGTTTAPVAVPSAVHCDRSRRGPDHQGRQYRRDHGQGCGGGRSESSGLGQL